MRPIAGIVVLTLCAACATGGARTAPRELDRAHSLAFYGIQEVLSREELGLADVEAICVGMGRDGRGLPPAPMLEAFSEHVPPVRGEAACTRTTGPQGRPVVRTSEGGPALFLSVFDVLTAPGMASVDIVVEASGEEPRILDCSFRERAERREVSRTPDPPSPGDAPLPRRPTVHCRD